MGDYIRNCYWTCFTDRMSGQWGQEIYIFYCSRRDERPDGWGSEPIEWAEVV